MQPLMLPPHQQMPINILTMPTNIRPQNLRLTKEILTIHHQLRLHTIIIIHTSLKTIHTITTLHDYPYQFFQ